MTQREKTLGLIVGGLLCMFAVLGVYSAVSGRYQAKESQIANLKSAFTLSNAKVANARKDRQRVMEYQRRSLLADATAAQREYDDWLHKKLREAGLTNVSTVPQNVLTSKKSVQNELSFTLSAEGDTRQITKFLHSFYSSDTLHRVRKLSIQRNDDTLKLGMTINALTMPAMDAKRLKLAYPVMPIDKLKDLVTKIALGTTNADRLPYSLDEYEETISNRNLFFPANQKPSISSISQQTVEFGEKLTFTAKADDPDGNDVIFSLGSDAPQEAEISESGRFSWRAGKEKADLEFKIYATDTGLPAKVDERIVKVSVEPPKPREERRPAPPSIDEAKLTVFTALIKNVDSPPYVWLDRRVEGETEYLWEGDKFKIGDWEGKVTLVDPDSNQFTFSTADGDFTLKIGKTLADAKFVEPKEL